MERLTDLRFKIAKLNERIENMSNRIEKMSDTEKTNVSKKFLVSMRDYLQELRQYKQLEEQGLMLKLPCKVGDKLYLTDPKNGITEVTVKEFVYRAYPICRMEIYFENMIGFETCLFDGTLNEGVFLTQAEDEEALCKIKTDEQLNALYCGKAIKQIEEGGSREIHTGSKFYMKRFMRKE